MQFNLLFKLTILCTSFLFIFASCEKADKEEELILPTDISDSFESGSLGDFNKISDTEWEIFIADDNLNTSLPASWRSWWYVRMDNLIKNTNTKLTIKNSGWPYYYVPVYSYDQKEWFRFDEDEIHQNSQNELVIEKSFNLNRVWIAMFYPYTLTDLETYIQTVNGSPYLDIRIAGTSQLGNPVYLIKATDFSVPVSEKKRILIHARTHPAETPPSFLIEGMIDFLLSGTAESIEILKKYEFHIFPMQNVDGVIAGNYRSTPQSENLELLWLYKQDNPLNLSDQAPEEVDIIHNHARTLMTDGGPIVSIALNLHASNSEEDIRPFFFPHFGPEEYGYTAQEASLWNKQLNFIDAFGTNHGFHMIEPVPAEGGNAFAGKTYPESWWWINYHETVMAMTMEMTYGRAGYAPNWIEPSNMREMGKALALAINDYFTIPVFKNANTSRQFYPTDLKYPDLYLPDHEEESKKKLYFDYNNFKH